MANDYARVMRSIWGDDDFRDLPHDAQWLYFHLLTSPALTYCGVTDWRPARIAALTHDLTADDIEAASVELEGNLFTVVDRDSEEVLVRTFVRHDGLMAVWNMAAAMAKAHSAVVSKALRGVIVHELKRLKDDEPDLKGWGRPEVKAMLRKTPLTAADALELLPRWTGESPKDCPKERGNGEATKAPSIGGRIAHPNGDASLPLLTPTPSPSPQHRGSDTYLSTEGTADSDSAQHLKVVNV